MTAVQLQASEKEEATQKLQTYLKQELDIDLGAFDAGFLLDFFAEHVGYRYYNQGLSTALAAMSGKMEEASDLVYELEISPPE